MTFKPRSLYSGSWNLWHVNLVTSSASRWHLLLMLSKHMGNFDETERFGFTESWTADSSNCLFRWLNRTPTDQSDEAPQCHSRLWADSRFACFPRTLGSYPSRYNLIVQTYLTWVVLVPGANDNTANKLHTKPLDEKILWSVNVKSKFWRSHSTLLILGPVECGC